MRILIADDDPIPRRLLQASLVRSGYEVVVASNGEEAWQILQQADAPKLAILDWQMPGMHGVEVCRKVRERQGGHYIYILLLTSKDRLEDLVEGMTAGADDYLTKPCDSHELQVRLNAGRRILDLETALRASLEQLEQAHHREVGIGAKIQQTLLLGQPPLGMPGAKVAAMTIPSQQIDGDFYDFFLHDNKCLDVVVGDVMGKGVPAALLGAAIKSHFLRALSRLLGASAAGNLPSPEKIITLIHDEVTRQFIGLDFFATLCYTRFDLEQRKVIFVDCGHTKTIHFKRREGICAYLEGENMPIGISEKEVYREVISSFEPGDIFCFYSDGVTEARNSSGEFYGAEGLAELIKQNSGSGPKGLLSALHKDVVSFSHAETFTDDLTCVIVEIGANDSERPIAHAELEVKSSLSELAPIREFVRNFCHSNAEYALDEDSLNELELAINEAASNVIRHAYHGRADEIIQISADGYPERVCFRINHYGEPFHPSTVNPPSFDGSREGGFGVYMIAESVDEVQYTTDESGKSAINLVKVRNDFNIK